MILQRYIHRETLQAFAAMLLLLVAIYASTRAVTYLGDAAAGKIAGEVILGMLAMKIITSTLVILPLCFYLGVLLALGRMRQDRELVAMVDAGCGPVFFHGQVARLAAGCAAFMALLSFVVVPWAERTLDDLEARATDEANVSGIVPGRFKEYSGGDRVLFVEGLSDDETVMNDVFLRIRESTREGVLKADSARLENDPQHRGRFVVFADGRRYLGEPGQADYSITEFSRYGVRLAGGREAEGDLAMGARPVHELWLDGSAHALAEIHWRLAMPVAVVLLGALAVALVRSRLLTGRYLLLFVGILVYFLYNNLLGIFRTLVKREMLDGLIGLWPVHLALIAVVLAVESPPLLRARRARRDAELLSAS